MNLNHPQEETSLLQEVVARKGITQLIQMVGQNQERELKESIFKYQVLNSRIMGCFSSITNLQIVLNLTIQKENIHLAKEIIFLF